MKNTFLVLLCLVWIGIPAMAQKIPSEKVPGPVMKAFKTKFPKVADATWEMENMTEYEVMFKSEGAENSVTFNQEGQWLMTERRIKVSELPESVRMSLAKQFAGFKIEEACKVIHAQHGNCFQAEIEKGKESYEVLFNAEGDVLNKKTEAEEKDKEEKD